MDLNRGTDLFRDGCKRYGPTGSICIEPMVSLKGLTAIFVMIAKTEGFQLCLDFHKLVNTSIWQCRNVTKSSPS